MRLWCSKKTNAFEKPVPYKSKVEVKLKCLITEDDKRFIA